MKIIIKTEYRGVKTIATCYAEERSYHNEASTMAAGISGLVSKLARKKALIGAQWTAPDASISGVIGDKIKKGRSTKSISEMDGFVLHGGMMH